MTLPSQHNGTRYRVRLYVAGNSPRSQGAIRTVARVCERLRADEIDLEIIDVYQQVERVRADRVFAVPMLVRVQPGPMRSMIGGLSHDENVISTLGLELEPEPRGPP